MSNKVQNTDNILPNAAACAPSLIPVPDILDIAIIMASLIPKFPGIRFITPVIVVKAAIVQLVTGDTSMEKASNER
ncbi:MAG: hypothetical protein AB1390_05030 [Nitrospirota bacterium]